MALTMTFILKNCNFGLCCRRGHSRFTNNPVFCKLYGSVFMLNCIWCNNSLTCGIVVETLLIDWNLAWQCVRNNSYSCTLHFIWKFCLIDAWNAINIVLNNYFTFLITLYYIVAVIWCVGQQDGMSLVNFGNQDFNLYTVTLSLHCVGILED